MPIITGLSGNEIYCLGQKGFTPGDLVIGNSVISIGLLGTIGSGLKTLFGGEVTQVTRVILEGRQRAYARMQEEAKRHGGIGITGVSNELIVHGTNIEFLAIGTAVRKMPNVGTQSDSLIPQAIIRDRDTFINTAETTSASSLNQPANATNFATIFVGFGVFALWIGFILLRMFLH